MAMTLTDQRTDAVAAVLPDARRALPLSARARTERKVFARLTGPLRAAAQRSADPFRFPPQPDDRLPPGLRRLLGLRLGAHRGGRVRCLAQPEAHPEAQRRSRAHAKSPPEATREQFALLRTYLDSRHAGGGMSDMGSVRLCRDGRRNAGRHACRRIPQARARRRAGPADGAARSPTCCATDCRWSTASIIPARIGRSLGTYMILDHIAAAQRARTCRTSISATGSRAATRWTTRRASARSKRSGPRAGRGCKLSCRPLAGGRDSFEHRVSRHSGSGSLQRPLPGRFASRVRQEDGVLIFFPAEPRLPFRDLLVGDLREQHIRRIDRLTRLRADRGIRPSARPATE